MNLFNMLKGGPLSTNSASSHRVVLNNFEYIITEDGKCIAYDYNKAYKFTTQVNFFSARRSKDKCKICST